ncbi:putative quinol monooxygenase [Streptomyces sp. NPDC017991]|uniref:putative quinol monooxygenase n=1 Tax=Streptomyces sp. NPDC017991 TaxID=3365026 RepID=UPI003793DE3D
MTELSVWANLTALPGQTEQAEQFFTHSRAIMRDEPGTTAFFVVKIDELTYGIFSSFTDQAALDEHAAGATGKDVVEAMVGSVFAAPPTITFSTVLQHYDAG